MKPIDRQHIYQHGRYAYKNFILLSEDEKKLVWAWRNDPRIRAWMTNGDEIPWENHLRFIESLKNRTDKVYWLVLKDEQPIGVFDIIDIDDEKAETEPGYYLHPDLLDSGEGLPFNFNFRSFLYDVLGFECVKGNIKVGNERALTISTFFGVFPIGEEMLTDGEHLIMRGKKEDFPQLTEKQLLKAFVSFARSHKIDWEALRTQLTTDSCKRPIS